MKFDSMLGRLCVWLSAGLATLAQGAVANGGFIPADIRPPAVPREFRGVWVATVKNIDWPSQPGLTTAQQKSELLAILDRAVQLRLNAVILQVRPSCDALYVSKLEPWSEYLSGRMGQGPQPFYDPLAFAVEEAHRRGLELHAWFNPYRARHESAISPVSKDHISKKHPTLVKTYGRSLWLDPAEKAVQEHSLNVVLDVVKRYDIDGVHFDDYFYPYPVKGPNDKPLPFPDWSSWKRYLDSGGKLAQDDWRREQVNGFIRRVSQGIKARKPWVKFGISPFGIWRPGHPPQIKGLDSYDELYADARKWLVEGWVDYLAPQLYWNNDNPQTRFDVLLKWWAEQNHFGRHLWPGLAASSINPARPPSQLTGQVKQTREQRGTSGNIHWSIKPFMENRRGVNDLLTTEVYGQRALVPASPWLDAKVPAAPKLKSSSDGKLMKAQWASGPGEPAWQWLVQTRRGGVWRLDLFRATQLGLIWPAASAPEVVSVIALDRAGNASAPAVLKRGL